MGNVAVYGFPVSTFVNIVRLVLTEKGVPFTFCDLESEMGSPHHLALHPFNRVPILDHDGSYSTKPPQSQPMSIRHSMARRFSPTTCAGGRG